ncbi:MAG TPA: FG-GAP-like repeat-containing protein, partial [Pyrinomonadaceae bacterium]|nr:FG-GAP-like repeat-containing protein [Pyrinomonadaceae bacterium]
MLLFLNLLKKNNLIFHTLSFALIIAATLLPAMALPGNFDYNFGGRGKQFFDFENRTDRIYEMAVQENNRIVVVGATLNSTNTSDFALMRLLPNGTEDDSFGTAGRVFTGNAATSEVAYAVAIQADGKIVVGGTRFSQTMPDSVFLLARYNENGTLDTTFGNGGTVETNVAVGFSEVINEIALQTINGEQKIVVTGTIGASDGSDFAVARYNANGSLDTLFDTDGIATVSWGNADTAESVTILQVNGEDKIVVAGRRRLDNGANGYNDDFALARLNSNGSLDTTFDTDGKVNTNISAIDIARSVAIQTIGNEKKILAAGLANGNFALVRYNLNGALDNTFGISGRTISAISPWEDQIHDMALLPDGRILVGGFTRGANNTFESFALARYNTDGTPDKTFGNCGTIITNRISNVATSKELIYGVAVTRTGKTIAAGHVTNGGMRSDDFTVVQYIDGGASTSSIDFDGDGKTDQAVFRDGKWFMNCSCTGFRAVTWGQAGDVPVPADYDGDGKTDVAVYRGGTWYVQRSSNNSLLAYQFGLPTDKPVAANYDSDDKADFSVFRPSNATWYSIQTNNGLFHQVQFGTAEDILVPGSYDNNGWITNRAVFRPSNGTWYTSLNPSNNYGAKTWGVQGDVPVIADFDGDGQTDLSVFRPSDGTWYINNSTAGFRAAQFGTAGDIPVAGDYDGDSKADIAVFRNGYWYILQST